MSGVFRHRFIPPPVSNPLVYSYLTDVVAPVLSNATGTETGLTTATGTVDTDDSTGTLYWVVTGSSAQPSVAQIQAGQDHTGSAADASGNQSVAGFGEQTVNATGITTGVARYFHFQQQDAGTNDSAVESSAFFVLRAPTLGSPSGSSTGDTTADGYVETDEAGGTLYWVVTTSNTAPSAAQIKAGQDHLGSSASASGSQAVSLSGVQGPIGSTGLSPATSYYYHYIHSDAASIDSNIVTSNLFTTTGEIDTTAPVLTNPDFSEAPGLVMQGYVDTDESSGLLYWVTTNSATAPSVAQIQAGQDHTGAAADDFGNQSVSSTGTQTVTSASSTPQTDLYFHFQHTDSSSNDSDVITSSVWRVGAPTLTSPTSEASGAGSVTTDEDNGIIYWVVTQSVTAPSALQVQSGQDHTGSNADDAGTISVDTSGVQPAFSSGLTVGLTYYFHFQHADAVDHDSTVVTSASFIQAAVSGLLGSLSLLGIGK